jgi:hypothetical protein
VAPDQFALCSYVVLLFELHVESGGKGGGVGVIVDRYERKLNSFSGF